MKKDYNSLKKLPFILATWRYKCVLIVFTIVTLCGTSYAQSWVNVGIAGFSAGEADYTSIAIDTGGTPYVVYSDGGNGLRTTVMKYNGSSWVNAGSAGFSASYANYTSIAINSNGTPYVVYEDGYPFDDTAKATVMKYNDSGWVNVGSAGFSAGQVQFTSIALDSNSTPYVVYQDGNSGPATVMKYNGSSWVTVGSTGFSDSSVAYTSIAIDRNGTPYVVYQDGGDSNKATVMKYDGGSWVTVGSAGFSAGEADFTFIAIDGSGTPYVVYEDYGNSYNATVMKYNGSSWETVGSAGFSAGQADCTTIAIDNTGTPYVTYLDWGYDGHATVMKYNGSSWITLGIRGFSAGFAQWTSIAIDNNGTPFVAYQDGWNGNKATVMKLDTALSPIIGIDTLCVGDTTTLSDKKSGGIWSSSNTTIATVGTAGFVTSLSTGIATISYTKDSYSTTFTMLVDSLPVVGILSTSVDSICPGDSIIIHNTVDGGTWISMDTSIANFISDGFITSSAYALLVGIATDSVTLVYVNSTNCGSDTATYSFRIGNCPNNINNITTPTVSLTIFPNPTHHGGSFTIDIATPVNEDAQIIITNMVGEKVEELIIPTNKETELQLHVPHGVYFITAVTENKSMTTKIVVE